SCRLYPADWQGTPGCEIRNSLSEKFLAPDMTPGGGVNQYKVRNTQGLDLHPAMPDLHPALPGSVPSPDRNFLSCEVPAQSYLFRTAFPPPPEILRFFLYPCFIPHVPPYLFPICSS